MLLVPIAVVTSEVLFSVVGTEDVASTLGSLGDHALRVRFSVLLQIFAGIGTIIMAVMLFATLRRADTNLAALALSCRLVEATLYAVTVLTVQMLLFEGQEYASSGSNAAAYEVLLPSLLFLKKAGSAVGAMFFAAGSLIFSYMFFKVRSIPIWLSSLGIVSSVVVLLGLALQVLDLDTMAIRMLIWLPLAVFEITLGIRLLVRGAELPRWILEARAT